MKSKKYKAGDKVIYVGKSIKKLKKQKGKIVQGSPFESLTSWEVYFEGHTGHYLCLETDLKRVEQQLLLW